MKKNDVIKYVSTGPKVDNHGFLKNFYLLDVKLISFTNCNWRFFPMIKRKICVCKYKEMTLPIKQQTYENDHSTRNAIYSTICQKQVYY